MQNPNHTHPHSEHGAGNENSFAKRLKAATRTEHDDTEKQGFFERIGKGEVTTSEYTTYLGIMLSFVGAIEESVAKQSDLLRELARQAGFPLSNHLERDIAYFQSSGTPRAIPEERRQAVQQAVAEVAAKGPYGLAGLLYLVGGSQHGASFMARALQGKGLLGKEFEGGAYLRAEGRAPLAERWKLFLQEMERVVADKPAAQDEILEATRKGYACMAQVAAACEQVRTEV